MNSASVAIIIPAYKPDFLKSALDSIQRQTSDDYHVYVADDGSPYDIESIVRPYMRTMQLSYQRFDNNVGGKNLVAHWHRAIAMSKSEPYIWLFSDDDIMGDECIASYLNLDPELRDNNLVHFNLNVLDSASGKILAAPKYPRALSAEQFLHAKLSGKIISYVVEFIFPRSIFQRSGGFENFDLAWGADFMTWIKMSALSSKGIISIDNDKARVTWRKSDKNISPDISHSIIVRKMQALIENACFLKRFMTDHPEKFQASLKSFRWLRFPLGDLMRKRRLLNYKEIRDLCVSYRHKVGYNMQSRLSCLLIMASKILTP